MTKNWSLSFVLGLFVMAMGISLVLFSPKLREFSQGLLFRDGREVLSSLEAVFDGRKYKVLKLRDIEGILIEIYEIDQETSAIQFVDRSYLSDNKDAYYDMNDKKMNLFLKDINKDNIPEIITPSYDRNLVAHLNIFAFDPMTRKFVKLSEH